MPSLHRSATVRLLALILASGLTLAGCGENASQTPASPGRADQTQAPAGAADHDHHHDDPHDHDDHEDHEDHDSHHVHDDAERVTPGHAADSDHAGHGHHHEAPHGGAMAPLGDHFAHIELKNDPQTGEITLWVLDGEALHGVRVSPPAVELLIIPHGLDHAEASDDEHAHDTGDAGSHDDADQPEADAPERPAFAVALDPVANVLTGETLTNTSQFAGQNDQLIGLQRFEVVVPSLTVRGRTFSEIRFGYPEGME